MRQPSSPYCWNTATSRPGRSGSTSPTAARTCTCAGSNTCTQSVLPVSASTTERRGPMPRRRYCLPLPRRSPAKRRDPHSPLLQRAAPPAARTRGESPFCSPRVRGGGGARSTRRRPPSLTRRDLSPELAVTVRVQPSSPPTGMVAHSRGALFMPRRSGEKPVSCLSCSVRGQAGFHTSADRTPGSSGWVRRGASPAFAAPAVSAGSAVRRHAAWRSARGESFGVGTVVLTSTRRLPSLFGVASAGAFSGYPPEGSGLGRANTS